MTTPADTLASLRRAPFGLDEAAIAWVRSMLASVPVEDLLRQLFNPAMHGEGDDDIGRMGAVQPGGITRFMGPNMDHSWQVARRLVDQARIPLLLSGDIEGGCIAIPFASRMPNPLGQAAMRRPALAEQACAVMADEARALGYNWSFTPVVDINAAFRSAIVATRSYGSDVDTIADLSLRHARAFQRAGLAATAKHWPGEGYDDRDQHLVTTINPLDMASWHARFGRLYRGLIDGGVMTVMSAHIALPAYARSHGINGLEACRPASLSRLLTHNLLREELGFNGLVVSDASAMAGLSSWADRAEAVPQIFNAGNDMLLFPSPFEGDYQHALNALRDGRLSEDRVADAATRVLGLKAALGLHRMTHDELLPPLDSVRQRVRSDKHLAVQQQAAAASVTLVKDTQALLPLSPQRHRRIVLVTDPARLGFASQNPLPLLLPGWLAEEGFEVRAYDPANPPTPADTDLVLYLLAQESVLLTAHIYLDWRRLQGDMRGAMARLWHQLPCLLVSFGHPYYLYDAPRMPCVVNAYTAIAPVQRAVLDALLGRAPFTAGSPVDAYCGLPDAPY